MLMVRSFLEVEQDSKERDVEIFLRLGKYIYVDNMGEGKCMEKIQERGKGWRKYWRERVCLEKNYGRDGMFKENIRERVCKQKI